MDCRQHCAYSEPNYWNRQRHFHLYPVHQIQLRYICLLADLLYIDLCFPGFSAMEFTLFLNSHAQEQWPETMPDHLNFGRGRSMSGIHSCMWRIRILDPSPPSTKLGKSMSKSGLDEQTSLSESQIVDYFANLASSICSSDSLDPHLIASHTHVYSYWNYT